MYTKELIVTVTEQIVGPVAHHLQKSIFTNDSGERVLLTKTLAIQGDDRFSVLLKPPPKLLLGHESY